MSQVLQGNGSSGPDLRSACRDQESESYELIPPMDEHGRYLSGPGNFIAGSWVNYAQQEPKSSWERAKTRREWHGTVDLVVVKPCEGRFGVPA